MRARSLIAALFVAVASTSAFAQGGSSNKIGPGSPAPALSVKTWLKGTPTTELDPSKTYVVEFWATWCGPCITSIPHVTKLAKENPDVTFMGIGIWEDEGPQLKAFVDKMGDKMGYNVGYSGNKDGMAVTWMDAAGQNGIPSAFIVKEGKIMWVGHPMSMDKPLAEIKAGTFDMAAFKAGFEKEAEMARKASESRRAMSAIDKNFKAGKRAEAKAALDKLVAGDANLQRSADAMRFGWLAIEDPKAWDAKAKTLAASKSQPERQMLLGFAMQSAQSPETHPAARKAIGHVLKATPDDFMALQYARFVYKETGDTQLALNVVEKLLKVLPTSPAKDNEDFKAALEKDRTDLGAKLAKKSS